MQLSEEMDAAHGPRGADEQAPRLVSRRLRPIGLRVLRALLLGFVTQYVIIAFCVGLSVAATFHYYVTPYVVANFEAVARALTPLH